MIHGVFQRDVPGKAAIHAPVAAYPDGREEEGDRVARANHPLQLLGRLGVVRGDDLARPPGEIEDHEGRFDGTREDLLVVQKSVDVGRELRLGGDGKPRERVVAQGEGNELADGLELGPAALHGLQAARGVEARVDDADAAPDDGVGSDPLLIEEPHGAHVMGAEGGPPSEDENALAPCHRSLPGLFYPKTPFRRRLPASIRRAICAFTRSTFA
jgi:hypothetical protein